MARVKDFEDKMVGRLFIPGLLGTEIFAVTIDPSRFVYNIQFRAQRAHDGLNIRGQYCVTESIAMEKHLDDLCFVLKDHIVRELQSYTDCSCKHWVDPRTHKAYDLPCEMHLENEPTEP